MRRTGAALALVAGLTGCPALGDPLGLIDYPALIAENAGRSVPLAGGARRIFLVDGVELTLDAQDTLTDATDRSGQTALGCVVRLVAEISAMARTCPGAVSPGQADYLDSAAALVLGAYAEASGALSRDVAARFETLVRARSADTGLCFVMAEDAANIRGLLTAMGLERVARVATPARLPVEEPCSLPLETRP